MAIFRNDVFVFAFGQSLLRYNLDLPLLRLLNKRVIANLAHGSEARPPYMDGYREFDVANSAGVVDLYRRTCENSRRVGLFERYADVVIGAPFSTSQFASRPFVNSFALGLPSVHNPREEGSNSSRSDSPGKIGDTVKEKSIVLHAPSNMRAKGTKHIRKVVAELNRAGGNVELHEIHGKSNQEVLNALRAADFIVDQLYSDTPLAGFASEAASVGKPSVVGGYGLERLEPFIPSELRTASYTCQPEDLLRAITDLADDPARVQRLGAAAQAFVESEWTCTKVATRFLCLIEDRVPMEWYLDPQEIVYVEGACQPKWVTRERIRSLVDHFGVDALCVTHNPQLLTALLKFAFESGRENMND